MAKRPYIQEPPFCVQVEFTEGCNLHCSFCGIQGIRESGGGPFKFMTLKTAEKVAADMAAANWTARVEFAMHGEPTMNPDFIELVRVFRKHLPKNQLMMTSNGGGLLKDTTERIEALFAAGLNILALDDYQTVAIVPKLRQRYSGGISVHDYPKDGLDYSPHRRHPRSTKMIVILEDIEQAAAGSHAVLTNHCGCGAPPNQSKAGQRCAKPFRELGVRWDGKIAGCCNDWRGVYKVGDATKTPIYELWNNEALSAMRRKLYAGERDFGACNGCDYVSYRNGLLPDKMGKATMGKPTPADAETIKAATRGRMFAIKVLRPWE